MESGQSGQGRADSEGVFKGIEHRPSKPWVVGSSPPGRIDEKPSLSDGSGGFLFGIRFTNWAAG